MKHPTRLQLIFVLTIGIFAVSTAAILIRLANTSAGVSDGRFSLVIAAMRMSIAAIVLAPKWRTFQAPSKSALWFAIAAGLSLAIHFATWISSLSYTSIAASTTLVTTNPIWVMLLSWLWLKEKPTRAMFFGFIVAFVGGILIGFDTTSDAGRNPMLGNGLAIVGAWAASLYILFGRAAQQRGFTIGNYVTIVYGVAAVALLFPFGVNVLLPLPFFTGVSYLGYPISTYGYIALMALLPQLVGHTSFNWAVRYLPPTLVTLVILLEPVGSTILASVLFREIPSDRVLIGAAILLVGVAIAVIGKIHFPTHH